MVESNLSAGVLAVDAGDLCSLQLHLVTLSTLCKEMITNLGKNKQLDQTLTHLLEKATSVMEPAIQAMLMCKGSRQIQSFSVEMVTIMIKSELARASISENDRQKKISRMAFYRSFCQQILKELTPNPALWTSAFHRFNISLRSTWLRKRPTRQILKTPY